MIIVLLGKKVKRGRKAEKDASRKTGSARFRTGKEGLLLYIIVIFGRNAVVLLKLLTNTSAEGQQAVPVGDDGAHSGGGGQRQSDDLQYKTSNFHNWIPPCIVSLSQVYTTYGRISIPFTILSQPFSFSE